MYWSNSKLNVDINQKNTCIFYHARAYFESFAVHILLYKKKNSKWEFLFLNLVKLFKERQCFYFKVGLLQTKIFYVRA